MSAIVFSGGLVTISRYAGPARTDGASRTMVQITLAGPLPDGSSRYLSMSARHWKQLRRGAVGLDENPDQWAEEAES